MAINNIYKLFASVSATTDAAAFLDIPTAGFISGIWGHWNINVADAVSDGAKMEISFASASQFTTNDSRSSIFGAAFRISLLTSGMVNSAPSFLAPPIKIPVAMNERVYMHITEHGAPTVIECTVWFAVDTAAVAQRRVRRVRRG